MGRASSPHPGNTPPAPTPGAGTGPGSTARNVRLPRSRTSSPGPCPLSRPPVPRRGAPRLRRPRALNLDEPHLPWAIPRHHHPTRALTGPPRRHKAPRRLTGGSRPSARHRGPGRRVCPEPRPARRPHPRPRTVPTARPVPLRHRGRTCPARLRPGRPGRQGRQGRPDRGPWGRRRRVRAASPTVGRGPRTGGRPPKPRLRHKEGGRRRARPPDGRSPRTPALPNRTPRISVPQV
jgi:hypothetical protein